MPRPSVEDVARVGSSAACEVYGIEGKGSLSVGSDADLVLFDPTTVGAGELCEREDLPGGCSRLTAAPPSPWRPAGVALRSR